MATETQVPDSITLQTNLVGAVGAIDEGVTSPGGDWLTASSNNSTSDLEVTFPTPTGSPNTGAGLQTFRAYARLTANGTACTYNIYLANSSGRLNGGTAVGTGSLTSTTGQTLSATWDATLLTTSDGSDVRMELEVVKSGGSPSNRTTGEVDAVEWIVDYSASVTEVITKGTIALTGQAVTDQTDWTESVADVAIAVTGQAVTDKTEFFEIPGDYTSNVNGQAVTDTTVWTESIGDVAITVTGQAVTTGGGVIEIPATGSTAMTGQAVTDKTDWTESPGEATVVATGQPVVGNARTTETPTTGSLSVSGQAVTDKTSWTEVVANAVTTVTGQAVNAFNLTVEVIARVWISLTGNTVTDNQTSDEPGNSLITDLSLDPTERLWKYNPKSQKTEKL